MNGLLVQSVTVIHRGRHFSTNSPLDALKIPHGSRLDILKRLTLGEVLGSTHMFPVYLWAVPEQEAQLLAAGSLMTRSLNQAVGQTAVLPMEVL